jgi:SpoVK/Ycf46/Vps4 family AAA+-type ATPase
MARADLLIRLVKAVNESDQQLYQKVVQSIIVEERKKGHLIVADRLQSELHSRKKPPINGQVNDYSKESKEKIQDFFMEVRPHRGLDSLILKDETLETVGEFIEEHQRKELLQSYNLAPRNTILLSGAPGNGKTSLAEAVAHELMLPLYVVRYDGIIGSYLGETATRLRKLISFVSAHECILFFDEFDSIGKERGDLHETGEIKRVVSSLLFQIDQLPSYVITIGATNHPELLDRAVGRRFKIRLSLDEPNEAMIISFLRAFENKTDIKLKSPYKTLSKKLLGCSFSDIEDFCLNIQRKYILSLPDANLKKITQKCLLELERRKQLSHGKKSITDISTAETG